jgi:uncharacterized membrane protein YdfJ with MMPL/SSD domain
MAPGLLPSLTPGGLPRWLSNTESIALYYGVEEYQYLFNRTVADAKNAALVTLYTVFDPFSHNANDYLNSVQNAVDAFADAVPSITMGLVGASSEDWAIMHAAMDLFPIIVGASFGIIFVFVALVFRSLFVPIRMVFTVAYTIGMAYGLGVLLFQYTWVDAIWHAMDGVKSFTWTVPIFSFSLLSALALDYDVFLLTRVVELKQNRYNDEAAISKAVWKTGRIISFAGIIMTISFGSLCFSNTTMLNQFGIVATFAVLVDTFLIRTFFVPALMSIFPSAAWWPRSFPEDNRGVEDMQEDAAAPPCRSQGSLLTASESLQTIVR